MLARNSPSLRPNNVHFLRDTRHARQVVREVARHDTRDSLSVLAERLAARAVLLPLAL